MGDKTSLSGYYKFNLKRTPDDAAPAGAENTSTAPADRPPFIFTAFQQELGLKREPQKVTVQAVVVDHIEKVPTGN